MCLLQIPSKVSQAIKEKECISDPSRTAEKPIPETGPVQSLTDGAAVEKPPQ